MKAIFQKIFKVLGSRLARNVYFWVLFMGPRLTFHGSKLLFSILLLALLMLQVYFNNLVLVPRLLVKKKYTAYFISVVVYTFFIACAYTITSKVLLSSVAANDVSFFSYPSLTKDLGFISVLRQMVNYSIGLLTMTFIFTMGWYMMDYTRQQKSLESATKKQMETELLFLKGQINPHFLFNTLNNLYALAVKKADQTPDAILKLSSILRYLLYESDIPVVSFEKEKEVMEAYIDLELLRLSDKEHLAFSITSDGFYSLPPLLWLPVLENVFKHGTRFIADNYFIDYRFNIENNKLTIYSKNSCKQANNTNGTETGGIGLGNLKHRLEILYPGKYTLTTGPDGGSYIVNVEILLS